MPNIQGMNAAQKCTLCTQVLKFRLGTVEALRRTLKSSFVRLLLTAFSGHQP